MDRVAPAQTLPYLLKYEVKCVPITTSAVIG